MSKGDPAPLAGGHRISAGRHKRDSIKPVAPLSGGAPPGAAPAHRAERRGQGQLKKWIPHRPGAMLRFLAIELASGTVVNELKLTNGANGPWIAMPAPKQFDRDGDPRFDANGKPIFNQIIEFRHRATSDGFSREIAEFIRAQYPDVENAS